MGFEVSVERGGQSSHRTIPRFQSFYIGRGAGNDLVVPDELVSWVHCRMRLERGVVQLTDLQSTNGTRAATHLIRGRTVEVHLGDRVEVGDTTITLTKLLGEHDGRLALEDINTTMRHAFGSKTLLISAEAHADVRIATCSTAHILRQTGPGEVEVRTDQKTHRLALREELTLGTATFRLVTLDNKPEPTFRPPDSSLPYELHLAFTANGHPTPVLADPLHGREVTVTAQNRAYLLHMLGQRILADRAEPHLTMNQTGWCSAADAIKWIWGRQRTNDLDTARSRLRVLIHRLRKDIEAAEMDPTVVEHRGGQYRLRVNRVVTR